MSNAFAWTCCASGLQCFPKVNPRTPAYRPSSFYQALLVAGLRTRPEEIPRNFSSFSRSPPTWACYPFFYIRKENGHHSVVCDKNGTLCEYLSEPRGTYKTERSLNSKRSENCHASASDELELSPNIDGISRFLDLLVVSQGCHHRDVQRYFYLELDLRFNSAVTHHAALLERRKVTLVTLISAYRKLSVKKNKPKTCQFVL